MFHYQTERTSDVHYYLSILNSELSFFWACPPFLIIIKSPISRKHGKKEPIPDLDKKHAFLAESATTLAKKILQKELKSEDLVRAVIERIKEVNPILNAIAVDRYETAIAEAKEVDEKIASGLTDEEAHKKPFLGVPFTTKESQAIKGMPLTVGLWSRRNEVASEDSEAIVRMKEAGAIVLAATNLPELLIWQETRNNVYGMTNNPHHTGRSPGGSSGAEAALTASYATAISLCSDIGGSTRMPAFYCGMFGHHPTPGTTNLRGVFFRKGDETDKDTMFALGFISKHVEDLAPLTKIVAGDKAPMLKLDREVDIKELINRDYYIDNCKEKFEIQRLELIERRGKIFRKFRKKIGKVITKIGKDVTNADNAPQPYHHEGFKHMYALWKYWMTQEPDTKALFTNNNGEPNALAELGKKLIGQSNHCLFSISRLLEDTFLPKPDAQWAEKLTKEFKEDLFGKLGDNGVLLLPSAPQVAPFHYSCLLRPFNFAYFAVVNALKCPATQVPLGADSEGLPLGIQVLAAPYNDALCLSVAKYLEKEFGGPVMACKIKQ
ncbi:hypothetical protein K1T71_009942 [Dendrolimus kikuchii]|uniref:Uncharacterized protein n=1 Tax=Dendrolimus kikuchii TaxID=765133 RepID=A0ACC1CTU4_9NEOP|nr:hypothetical protein K1T71_009942 [Dendrolimus kikuchii]